MQTIKQLSFLLMFLPLCIFAQDTVKGTVIGEDSGAIPGVNIIIKGTDKGTTSDFDGHYAIVVEQGQVLVYSYLGFKSQEITYVGQNEINVTMGEDTAILEEVLVIGYGTAKKEDLTGAVDMVSSKDFNKGPINSAQELITGKIAGVNVTSASGSPGDGQTITIRGLGSLSLENQPLYVIDGIPIDNGGVGGSRNPLNIINPNDIESMTVLKDASATAIYGSRAANGVIQITTKKGKDTKEFRYDVSLKRTVRNRLETVDVMSASEFKNLVNNVGTPDQIGRLGDSSTDWQEQIYTEQATGEEFNMSALGNAFGFMPMRASIGYTNQDGILRGDNFTRYTGGLNLTPRFFDDQLKVTLNVRGSYVENIFANRDAIGSAVSFDPTQPIYDSNSPFGGYFAWIDPQTGAQRSLAPTNPVASLNLVDDHSEVRRIITNLQADYDLTEHIKATVNVGYDESNSNGRTITSDQMPTDDQVGGLRNGARTTFSQTQKNKLFDAYLTYENTFNDVHSLTAVAGYSYQKFEYDNYSYDSEKEEQGNTAEFIDRSKNVLLSYFGRANYNYDSRYLLTASLRADASSKLNPDDRWGYFPSFSAAWNIHNESFMDGSDFFNVLKLRGGYGQVGNVNGLGDYNFLTRYTSSQSTANYQIGNSFYQTYRPEPYNEDLKWEVGSTINVGLDYAFLDDKVSGSINAYIKKTEDLIAFTLVDPFTNFGNKIDKNIGDMENKGIEFAINYKAIDTDDWSWNLGYNVSFNDNEITNLPDEQNVGGISGGTGNNIQLHREGETPYSYYVYEQVYDSNGRPIEGVYVDRNNDGVINDDDRYIKENPYADVLMGFNTNLSYKNWDLSVQSRVSLGNYAYNNVASANSYERKATENQILSNLHSDYFNTGFKNITQRGLLSDYHIQDASFFRIDNVTLGYNFNSVSGNTQFRVYGSVQNLLTVTDYDGIDPEISGGIDNNFYPRPRTFVLGLNVDL
ncbi:SusC/RagA family TonB-linked outer membrane protein [Psychroflexus halocasei]|uniref:Iron complex outermembrane recepter protein n=1 Tax=Psychroflexus halocasei TaxID=908615 RepID=A0A1H3WZ70_9FLAO|nr:TonB-dependent receptor [Psychroflexus halocasei]SDZ91642.1 iron complex outermembrane recepter protein [Psychroflexus halocasei]